MAVSMNCSTCKFGKTTMAPNEVQCRRFPPTMAIHQPVQDLAGRKGIESHFLFPIMQQTDWCGEHQTKVFTDERIPAKVNGSE